MAKWKTVDVEIPKVLVHEHDYFDKVTGEGICFNKAEIPDGALKGWEFSPKFLNPSKLGRDDLWCCPLIEERPVRLDRVIRNDDGSIKQDEDGKYVRERMEVPVETIRGYFADLITRNWEPETKEEADEDIPF